MAQDDPEARDLALIGVGDWGRNLARCFDALGALAVVVACDSGDRGLWDLRTQYPRARASTSVAETLADSRIRKVAIAAPAGVHFELAEAALKAGKDVFVEKPLCLRLDHAETLVKLADGLGKILMVGHLLQYHPCVVKLRELVAEGALGELLTITSNRLNLGKFRSEENALWSFAPHDVSVILSLLGDRLPESVRCMGGAYLNRKLAGSTTTVMRFAGDAMAQIYVSWLNPFKEQKLTVVGTDGMVVFDDTLPWVDKLTLYRKYLSWSTSQEPVLQKVLGEAVTVPHSEPLQAECAHFLEACRERSQPRTDGREGVRVLRVLGMAQRSLEQDGESVCARDQKAQRELGGTELAGSAALESGFFAHPTAIIDDNAVIGTGTRIWHYCQVMGGAKIGERCSFGRNVHVADGVVIGNDVKVQDNVSIYTGVELEDDVFLGPACVLTNVTNPRSQVSRRSLYEKTLLRRGATVGANATLVCGITLGRYSFIAAGAVVTKDVPDYALMVGNPAQQQGWMSRHGHRLKPSADGAMVCPEYGLKYREIEPGTLRCLDLDEDAPLPEALRVGQKTYAELKACGPISGVVLAS